MKDTFIRQVFAVSIIWALIVLLLDMGSLHEFIAMVCLMISAGMLAMRGGFGHK